MQVTHYLFLVLLVLNVSCNNNSTKKQTLQEMVESEEFKDFMLEESNSMMKDLLFDVCSNKVEVGGKTFCIPKVKGFEECYMNNKVKSFMDGLHSEYNRPLGFYMDTSVYNNEITDLSRMRFDNYGQFFISYSDTLRVSGARDIDHLKKESKAYFVDATSFKAQAELIIKEKWPELSLGKIVLIEEYEVRDNEYTFVTLCRINNGVAEVNRYAFYNILRMNGRILYFHYFYDYEDSNSLEQAKSINNNFINVIMNNNRQ